MIGEIGFVACSMATTSFLSRWYHGNISGREAEILLQDKAANGSYLVRASYHSPGDYVLSAK